MESKDDGTAVAYVATNVTDGDLVVGLLNAQGIGAYIDSENVRMNLDGYVGERVIRIRVPASDLEAARFVIEESKRESGGESG